MVIEKINVAGVGELVSVEHHFKNVALKIGSFTRIFIDIRL